MGLSERKVKQRIGADPRNLTWSTDTSRFSYKHMTALGWSDQKGIGAELQGNPNHIAVSRKQDNGGIGMGRVVGERQEAGLGAGSGSAGRGFEDVLKRLAAAGGGGGEAEGSASPSPGPSSSAAPDVEVGAGSGLGTTHRNASRRRHLHAKRLASSNPAALAEILGVPIDTLPASPAASAGPSTPRPQSPLPPAASSSKPEAPPAEADEPEVDHGVTTSTVSVADYFKQKMRDRMAARQAGGSGGSTTPDQLPAGSLAALPEDKPSKVLSGTAWEGEKVVFTPEQEGAAFEPSDRALGEDNAERAAKRARKEARRLRKEQKATNDAEKPDSTEDSPQAAASVELGTETPEERAQRKAAKKVQKAAKLGVRGAGTPFLEPGGPERKEKKRKHT